MKIYFPLFLLLLGCTAQRNEQVAYRPFSKSVMHIKFGIDPVDSLAISATAPTVIPYDLSESNSLAVRKAGDYYLNIEIDRPTKGSLRMGSWEYNIFILPQDTTHIEVKVMVDEPELSFAGKSKTINEYYLEKRRVLGYTEILLQFHKLLTSKSTYKLMKQIADSVCDQERLFLQEYTLKKPLPEWFLDYERSEIAYTEAGYKTFLPQGNQIMNFFQDTVPNDYFDFLSLIDIQNPKAVLSSRYFSFLDEYFLKDLPVSEFHQLSGIDKTSKIRSHLLNKSKKHLSGHVKEIYQTYSFSSVIRHYTDSVEIDSIAKAFQVVDYHELVTRSRKSAGDEIVRNALNKGDTIPDFILVDQLDSLVSIKEFQDKVLYVNFWAPWCGPCIHNIPMLNDLIARYKDNTKIEFLNICIDSDRDKWLASVEKHNLRGVNLIAEGNWASKLKTFFNIQGIPHYVIIDKGILFENATKKAPYVQKKIEEMLSKK